ncbi:hypothetical protein JCM6882_006351 [Rhodosporidiobolus microsporus]
MDSLAPLPLELLELVTAALPRLKRTQQGKLADELRGLWWGLRTGTLVDSVMLSEEEAEALGRGLSKSIFPLFVVYEPTTAQTLGINGALAERFKEGKTPCVEVGGRQPELASNLPPLPLSILRTIASHSSSPSFSPFLRLDPVERPHDLVGPVGFLLDYPRPYCIDSESGRNCLGGLALQVEDVFLAGRDDSPSLRLLSFSFPTHLFSPLNTDASDAASPPDGLTLPLISEFEARLRRSNDLQPEWGLGEYCLARSGREVVLDRVAL